ncbi:MAG TPA: FAD-binding oxidoreductase, partial [Gemmatimonadaceae bacterium]|nr:FAD-binding oxidoreductase [Gemmatimonadaceae bacterium]
MYAEGAGIARTLPEAVVVPRDAEDLLPLVEWAGANRVKLIPRGSGSGMAGGAVGPGVVVDCSLLKHIGPVDVARRTVRCGPGATRSDVNATANASGLRFPVDPSSGPFCTMGGMTATNASGARTLRFGATRRWIESIDCVLADGTFAAVRRDAAPPSSPALARITNEVLPRWHGHAGLRHPVRKESSGYAVASAAESGDLVDLL